MRWMIWGLVAALTVSLIAYIMRKHGLNWKTMLFCYTFYWIALWGFSYGYFHGPHIVTVYLSHTGISACLSFVLAWLIFKEEISWNHIVGAAVVLIGVVILNGK